MLRPCRLLPDSICNFCAVGMLDHCSTAMGRFCCAAAIVMVRALYHMECERVMLTAPGASAVDDPGVLRGCCRVSGRRRWPHRRRALQGRPRAHRPHGLRLPAALGALSHAAAKAAGAAVASPSHVSLGMSITASLVKPLRKVFCRRSLVERLSCPPTDKVTSCGLSSGLSSKRHGSSTACKLSRSRAWRRASAAHRLRRWRYSTPSARWTARA